MVGGGEDAVNEKSRLFVTFLSVGGGTQPLLDHVQPFRGHYLGIPGKVTRTLAAAGPIPKRTAKWSARRPLMGNAAERALGRMEAGGERRPELQQIEQEVVSSVGRDVNGTPAQQKKYIIFFKLPAKLKLMYHLITRSQGGNIQSAPYVVVMISSLVLRTSSTGPWYLSGGKRTGGTPSSRDAFPHARPS